MHGFVNMGSAHISFRDPFVFLLHSNVDRLFALWQTQRGHKERLDPDRIYGPESDDAGLNGNVEPWSTGHSFDEDGNEHFTRPWFAPEIKDSPIPTGIPQSSRRHATTRTWSRSSRRRPMRRGARR